MQLLKMDQKRVFSTDKKWEDFFTFEIFLANSFYKITGLSQRVLSRKLQ